FNAAERPSCARRITRTRSSLLANFPAMAALASVDPSSITISSNEESVCRSMLSIAGSRNASPFQTGRRTETLGASIKGAQYNGPPLFERQRSRTYPDQKNWWRRLGPTKDAGRAGRWMGDSESNTDC